MDFFESCGFYTYLYAGSVLFMLYLFCYVLRVRYDSDGKDFDEDFDVDDFVRRVTKATGLDVSPVEVNDSDRSCQRRRFSLRPTTLR